MIVYSYKKIKYKIVGNAFIKNTLILSLATIVAQLVSVLISPILSRLYTPEAFGELGNLVAFTSIFVGVSTLKYEMAIVLSKSSFETKQLIKWSHALIVFTSIIAVPIYMLVYQEYDILLLLFICFIIYLNSFLNLLINIFTRLKRFKNIAKLKILSKLITAFSQVSMGYYSLGFFGLAFGQILGLLLSFIITGFKTKGSFLKVLKLDKKSYQNALPILKLHYRFPLYTAPQNLMNALSQNAPILLMDYFFGNTVVGLYWFAYRIIQLPITFISNSIRQTFFQKASVTKKISELKKLHNKSTKTLFLIGLPITIIGMIILPYVFGFVFGEEWQEAGEFAKWLLPWILFLFMNPPSIMLIPILKLQKFNLYYDAFLLIFRVIAVCIGGYYFNPEVSIILFSFVGMSFNIYIILYINYKLK